MFRARESVRFPVLLAAALAPWLAGCPADDVVVDIDASVSCIAATHHDDLPWIQDNVFTPSCSNFTSCHKGAASMAGDLSLETGRSRAELVGVPSKQFPTWTLVVPSDPRMWSALNDTSRNTLAIVYFTAAMSVRVACVDVLSIFQAVSRTNKRSMRMAA